MQDDWLTGKLTAEIINSMNSRRSLAGTKTANCSVASDGALALVGKLAVTQYSSMFSAN